MNRRDAAFLAHLDQIEDRYLAVIREGFAGLDDRFDRLEAKVDQLAADVAGIKVDLATHHHDDGAE